MLPGNQVTQTHHPARQRVLQVAAEEVLLHQPDNQKTKQLLAAPTQDFPAVVQLAVKRQQVQSPQRPNQQRKRRQPPYRSHQESANSMSAAQAEGPDAPPLNRRHHPTQQNQDGESDALEDDGGLYRHPLFVVSLAVRFSCRALPCRVVPSLRRVVVSRSRPALSHIQTADDRRNDGYVDQQAPSRAQPKRPNKNAPRKRRRRRNRRSCGLNQLCSFLRRVAWFGNKRLLWRRIHRVSSFVERLAVFSCLIVYAHKCTRVPPNWPQQKKGRDPRGLAGLAFRR